jgi:hypothetical protein
MEPAIRCSLWFPRAPVAISVCFANKNREHNEQSRYDCDHAHARLLELEHSPLVELITMTSGSVQLQDYGRGCLHRPVKRLDEARTEWDVVVLTS